MGDRGGSERGWREWKERRASRQHKAPEEWFLIGMLGASLHGSVAYGCREAESRRVHLAAAQGSGRWRWLGSATEMSSPIGLEPVSILLF